MKKDFVTVEFNGKKVEIPFIKCRNCEGTHGTCKKCLETSLKEAFVDIGEARMIQNIIDFNQKSNDQ